MDMKTYLNETSSDEIEALVKRLDTSEAYLKQIASGFRQAGPKFAKRIEAETSGAVTKAELRPDIYDAA